MPASLPLIRLSLLRPFVQELTARNVDPGPVFESFGLSPAETLDPELSVHVMVATQLVETAAEAAGDRYLGARVGSKIDLDGWPLLAEAEARATTVGDYLSIFVSHSGDVASSATEYLNIAGPTAVFGEARSFEPTILPAQNDAFMAALGRAILRRALHDRFDPSQVTILVSDPKALPPEFNQMHPIRGNRMGFSIRFPSRWLTMPFEAGCDVPPCEADRAPEPAGFLPSFRQLLRAHVGNGPLTAADCAAHACLSRSLLKRRLAECGTSISGEIDRARQDFARRRLATSDVPVLAIATSLGYADAANFARAFRKAHGVSPTGFRHAARGADRESGTGAKNRTRAGKDL